MNRKRLLTLSLTIALVIAVAGTVFAQTKKAAPAKPAEDTSNLMDINTAPPEKLMTLNNIDIVLAKKIIAGRPYKNKTELTSRKIIPQAAYDGIWNKITAVPVKK